MRSGEFFVQPTGDRPGRRSSIRTRTLVRQPSHLIVLIRRSCMVVCGLRGRAHGRTAHGKVRAAAWTKLLMEVTPGDSSRKDCQRLNKALAALASPSLPQIPTDSTQLLTPHYWEASTARMTQVRVGKEPLPIGVSGPVEVISLRSMSILKTKRSFTAQP